MIYNCFCTSLPPFHRLSAYLAPFCVCLNFRVWFCSPQHQRSPTMWNKSDVLRFPWLIKSPLISLWKQAPYALQSESGCTSVRRVHCGMEPIASGQKNKQDLTCYPVHFLWGFMSILWLTFVATREDIFHRTTVTQISTIFPWKQLFKILLSSFASKWMFACRVFHSNDYAAMCQHKCASLIRRGYLECHCHVIANLLQIISGRHKGEEKIKNV